MNFKALSERKKGEKYLVSENGTLKTMNCMQKCRYFLQKSYREEIQGKVAKAIEEVTQDLSTTTLEGGNTEEKIAFLEDFFFNKLSRLSLNVYKRTINAQLYKDLQEKSSEGFKNETTICSRVFKEKLQQAQFWGKLGSMGHPDGSITGSVIVIRGQIKGENSQIQEKKTIGIFKSQAGDRPNVLKKIYFLLSRLPIFHLFFGNVSHTIGGESYLNERAAFVIGEKITQVAMQVSSVNSPTDDDYKLVPETHIVNFYNQRKEMDIGSFQLWEEKKCSTASSFFETERHYEMNSPKSTQERMEKFSKEWIDLLVIFDLLTANQDRHGENWLITRDESGDADGIRLIDGGNIMPLKYSRKTYFLEYKNMYLWQKLPGFDRPFTPFGKKVIQELLKDECFDKLMVELKGLYTQTMNQKKEVYAKLRLERMEDGAKILQRAAKEDLLLNQVAKTQTRTEVAKYLK